MFYSLFSMLDIGPSFLNIIINPSFRMIMALITGALITFSTYPFFIKKLKLLSFGQAVRDDGPKTHLKKSGTPTMGGLLLLFAIVISCLLWGDLSNIGLWLLLYVLVGFGAIGFVDDLKKVLKKNSLGLSAQKKFITQAFIAWSACLILSEDFSSMPYITDLAIPFIPVDIFTLNIPSWLYIAIAVFIIVGTSNGVNLTDGLDGLAIGPVIMSSLVFLILALMASISLDDFDFARYFRITPLEHAYELSIFCGAVIGASLGFLWYNTYPAQIFMGDVGSLALGGALGMLAILSKHELMSALINGVFLIETASVILQVLSFRMTKKRIFKMAPLHHHFELIGWAEPQVIVRFWIASAFLALIALSSFILR